MPTLVRTITQGTTKKVVTKSGKVSCSCCTPATELEIKYDWSGTGMYDLDAKTTAFSESVGWACGDSGTYVLWLPGGDGDKDDTSINGFERVNVRVDAAKTAGLWSSSYNIECFSGWFEPAGGSGSAQFSATYKGITKSKTIFPGEQNVCAGTSVATVTVYSTVQGDGSFFDIT